MIASGRLISALGAVGIVLAAATPASAQTYPTRPIRLIVPFAAGGQPDLMARLVAQHLSSSLGTAVVENRQGAGGTLGAKSVAAADPDGHTLLLGTTGVLAISPALYKDAGYDPIKSFKAAAMVSSAPFVLVAAPEVAADLASLVTHAKTHPGKLNYGAPTATPPHLACELFKQAAGIDIVRVPFAGNHLAGLLGGQIQIVCEATTVLLPHIQASKVRPLAVFSSKRAPELPNVPTLSESGVPGPVISVWTGIVAPAGTSAGVVGKLNEHINAALQSAGMRESLAKFGAEPRTSSPQEFAALIAEEARSWADMVRKSGAKP
jgi:tripartite-type tricarboxylate transporter receptor subunit TctC